MAYSSASLSANELAWAALDKPFLSNNALYSDVELRWVIDPAGEVGDADESDTDKPATRLNDAKPGFTSSPDSASTEFTITIDASAAPITFDWFGIINHNLKTLNASQIEIWVSDNADFSAPFSVVYGDDPITPLASDTRVALLSLTHTTGSLRYTDVPYVRIIIECDSGVPFIGQLVFGRRRQQPYLPDMAWDPSSEETTADDYVSKTGVIHRVSRGRGQRRMAATFIHDVGQLQTETTLWWDDIEGGEQPFFYIDEPTTSPMGFWMMYLDPPELPYPYIAPNARELTINAFEQGPHFVSQE